MIALSIDIETLGINIDSQILSIGACIFDINSGDILHTSYSAINLDPNKTINATSGAVSFWIEQVINNRKALNGLLCSAHPYSASVDLPSALNRLSDFIAVYKPETVWANSPKFDLAMLEYQYKSHGIDIPWKYNQDRCLRTLRHLCGDITVEKEDNWVTHNALSDAKWQAKYISQAIAEIRGFKTDVTYIDGSGKKHNFKIGDKK
jgi:hypothetical protein